MFFVNLIDLFKIGFKGTHVGVIVYSNKAKLVFSLSQFYDPVELQLQLLTLEFQYGNRRIDLALKKAGRELFSVKEGDRKKVPDVLVVMTSGNTIKNSEPYEDVLQPLKVLSCWNYHFLKRYNWRNELNPWANHNPKQTLAAGDKRGKKPLLLIGWLDVARNWLTTPLSGNAKATQQW